MKTSRSTPDPDAPGRTLSSLVASRFDIQLPVLLVFVAFVVAAAIFLFREIAADRLRIVQGDQPITFVSESAEGLGFGSELRCQGLTVGRVRAVRVVEKNGAIVVENNPQASGGSARVRFQIVAALDKPYANWVFRDHPLVRAGFGPTVLGLASIELAVAEVRPRGEKSPPQTLSLKFEEGRLSGMQDDAALLLESVVRRSDLLGERVRSGEATSVERTLWNLDRFTEKLDVAVTALTVDGADRPSPLKRMVDSADKLGDLVDQLGAQVKDLTKESTRTVQQSQAAIAKLDATVSRLDRNSLEVMGETPAQRKAVRTELLETLHNLRNASDSLRDLIPRIGETAFGRMLVKKKPPEDGAAGSERPKR
ncbi:MAG: hypothetical protein WCS65_10930 [Verrucomicrobiae bacterium]